ncbi:membrane protein insertion efficiency factor YidD [Nostoc sp. FACHB-110]|uniref:membrane protein insertion efficiency factor YidD n=1 Tax=Nostoc sp. FACHB-110 TaxID=2692834 RepID=UPI00168997D4|nr:membrane protein insertion efficiency factor YidD [Nostoc sp. FACHB-110]
MQISLLDSLSRRASIMAITSYQRHISPHKGFVCAHRILYGGASCSAYVKKVVAQEGLRVALIKSRARFQACKQANLILHSQSHNSESTDSEDTADIQHQKKEKDNGLWPNSSCRSSDLNGCTDCADLSCNCADIGNTLSDCDISHCQAIDGNFLDCGGADCSFLDCGSCGGA